MAIGVAVTRRRLAIVAGVAIFVALAVGVWWVFVGGTYCAHEHDPTFVPQWSQNDGSEGVSVTVTAAAGEELPADRLIVTVDDTRASWVDRSPTVDGDDTIGAGANLTLTGLESGDEVTVELWDPRPPQPRNRCSSTANFTYDTYVVE